MAPPAATVLPSQITGQTKADYIPHHQPFQYYVSTQNLQHTRPTSVATIGQQGDAGNHQYDTHDFFDAVNAGNFPAVSFLKAPGYQDGHAGYSDPLDEQTFIVDTINFLSQTSVVGQHGGRDHLRRLGRLVRSSARPDRQHLADQRRWSHRRRAVRHGSSAARRRQRHRTRRAAAATARACP